MYKIISNLLLFALFVSATAFTATHSATNRSEASAPVDILTLAVDQIAPGTAKVVWSSSNDGPFTVSVEDVATNQVVYFNNGIYDNDVVIPGLQPSKYTVTVLDNWNALDEDFVIQ